MNDTQLINAVSESIINQRDKDKFVQFKDSDVSISWHEWDNQFCIEGFRAGNFVAGFWDYSSCSDLKCWIKKLKRSELEDYLACPSKFWISM